MQFISIKWLESRNIWIAVVKYLPDVHLTGVYSHFLVFGFRTAVKNIYISI